jgi:predicted AAA+ superfamily ATPase
MESIHRHLEAPTGSFFLFGPRGTGKSTWLRSTFPDALHVDLLQPEVARSLSARPERLKELIAGARAEVVVVDEIQRVPELLPLVHALIEKPRRLRFALTGSSSRKLKRAGVDLLAGRAALRTMHPFTAAELGKRFVLAEALKVGTVPLVVAAPDPAEVLASYVALYVREEVQLEGLVRNLGAFYRFLEAVALAHGASLSVATVARDCEVERKTVEGYVGILEDLLLAYRVPVFAKKAKRKLAAHSKLYFFDPGVFRSLRPAGSLDGPADLDGPGLEGLVAEHLRAWRDYSGLALDLYYWRTRGGVEVDFVLYGKDGFAAIEVKSRSRVRPEDLHGLQAFREDHPGAQLRLLYRGHERLEVDGILCLPVDDFLKRLEPRKPLPN